MTTAAGPLLWVAFGVVVTIMLVLDLGVFHRRAHVIGMREALGWTVVWITVSLLFNAWVYVWLGSSSGLEFLTGYVIEKALSVDNLFVIAVIFSYFAVPAALQHRVLFWGIIGAIATRAVFVFAGAALLHAFHSLIYLFGAFLVFTGIRLLVQKDEEVHPEKNPVVRLLQKVVPAVSDYRGSRFTVIESGKRYATPLLLVLVTIEATDVVFAVDSIPAVFAVTEDPFIVLTSNIFAVLGLRALYFVLAGVLGKFRYLKIGLALVLSFVGLKMMLAKLYPIPIAVSLGVVVLLLAGSILLSLLPRRESPSRDSAG
jgi:tellurite resistance protein TerC